MSKWKWISLILITHHCFRQLGILTVEEDAHPATILPQSATIGKSDTSDIVEKTNQIDNNPATTELTPEATPGEGGWAMLHGIRTVRGGEGNHTWGIVDWNHPFTAEEESRFSCDMTTFQSASSVRETQMCVHSFQDSVSDEIRHNKHWYDCDVLPSLWNEVGYIGSGEESSYYVDIGSNIGSCVIEMLLATDAKIIAFEPHPMNYSTSRRPSRAWGNHSKIAWCCFQWGLEVCRALQLFFLPLATWATQVR